MWMKYVKIIHDKYLEKLKLMHLTVAKEKLRPTAGEQKNWRWLTGWQINRKTERQIDDWIIEDKKTGKENKEMVFMKCGRPEALFP